MPRINDRERIAQVRARTRLDAALQSAEQAMLKVIAAETSDMVFGFMMDAAADLPPAKVEQVRSILRAFRYDREACTRKIVEIRRRELSVLLQDEPQPLRWVGGRIQFFARWAKE